MDEQTIKDESVMALEIELQGLKEELFKERDLRRKESLEDNVLDTLRTRIA